MPYLQNSLTLIIETLIGLFLFAVVLRFLFQLFRVDFKNPISQTIVSITNPALKPFRRIIPGLFGIDLAAVVLIFLIGMLKLYALRAVSGLTTSLPGAMLYTLADLANMVFWILLLAIIIRALISWVSVSPYHPAIRILDGLSDPILSPFRRLMPNLGGIDITPIFAILGLNLVRNLLIYPVYDMARALL